MRANKRRGAVVGATAVLAALTLTLAVAQRGPQTSVQDNKLSFALPDLDGETVSLTDEKFKGKVVLVDIWGTWCPPCRAEIPHLVKFYEKYKDQGFEIVGVAFESESTDVARRRVIKAYAKKNGIEYTLLDGGRNIGGQVERAMKGIRGFGGFPTGIFIGRDGKVREVDVGFSDSMAPELEKRIVALLEEPEPSVTE